MGSGAEEVAAYKKAGAKHVVEGGGLCKSRNAAIEYDRERGKFCVQMSDDIHAFTFVHHAEEWIEEEGRLPDEDPAVGLYPEVAFLDALPAIDDEAADGPFSEPVSNELVSCSLEGLTAAGLLAAAELVGSASPKCGILGP